MEHVPLWGKAASFIMQSTRINNRTILNAKFMNECSLILAVSTIAIHVCVLASILPCNLAKYLSISQTGPYICQPHSWLAPFMADKLATLRLFSLQYSCTYWSNFETLSCYINLNTLSQGIILFTQVPHQMLFPLKVKVIRWCH